MPRVNGDKPMHDIPEVAAKPDGRPDEGTENAPMAEAAQATASGIEEQLKKAESTAREHQEAWLRAKAEADNIRKRAQTEIASAHKFALENFAGELLPVRDSLEAALSAENGTTDSIR